MTICGSWWWVRGRPAFGIVWGPLEYWKHHATQSSRQNPKRRWNIHDLHRFTFMMLWEKNMTAICRFAYTFIMFMCLVHVFQDSRCFSLSLQLTALLWLEAPSQKKGSKLHCGSAFGAISCSCGWTDGCTAAAFEAVILTTPDYYWVPQTVSLWVLNGFDMFWWFLMHFWSFAIISTCPCLLKTNAGN